MSVIEQADSVGKPISLVIPGKPEYVGLCRLVAGVVGAREFLDEEVIADLKLVVSEACTCFLRGSEASQNAEGGAGPWRPESLRVDFEISPESWRITVSDPDRSYRLAPISACAPMTEESLGLTIINALVDSLEQTESDEGGSMIRLVKRLQPQPAAGG